MPKLSRADWQKIQFDYVHRGVRVVDLADLYSIKLDTIYQRVKREGWADKRVEAEQKAYAEAAADASKKRVKELAAFNEGDIKISHAIRSRIATRLANVDGPMTMSELRVIASTAEVAQRMGRLALGASTDNVGHAGPGGEGPVAVTNVSKEDYIAARNEILEEF